jgi:hypothetical protein
MELGPAGLTFERFGNLFVWTESNGREPDYPQIQSETEPKTRSQAFLLRSALAEWPVSPRESVNPPPTLQGMAEQYEVDQSASRGSGPDIVIRQEITIINELVGKRAS